MIEVGLLTIEQKDELVGQMYDADSYFFPIHANKHATSSFFSYICFVNNITNLNSCQDFFSIYCRKY